MYAHNLQYGYRSAAFNSYGRGNRAPHTAGESRRIPMHVPEQTGPLNLLRGQKIIVIADVQNLTAGANTYGCKFSYDSLARILREASVSGSFHAFYAAENPENNRNAYFKTRGWTPYPYQVHHVETCRGLERRSNVDTLLACIAGARICTSPADVVVLCSGDGGLVTDLAQAVLFFPKPRKVVTVSLAGSTAQSLNAQHNPLIAANIECGRDVLRRLETL